MNAIDLANAMKTAATQIADEFQSSEDTFLPAFGMYSEHSGGFMDFKVIDIDEYTATAIKARIGEHLPDIVGLVAESTIIVGADHRQQRALTIHTVDRTQEHIYYAEIHRKENRPATLGAWKCTNKIATETDISAALHTVRDSEPCATW